MRFPLGFAAGFTSGFIAAFAVLVLAAHAIDKTDHA
jgi:hypothetical protein